jgi:hypothetical protein
MLLHVIQALPSRKAFAACRARCLMQSKPAAGILANVAMVPDHIHVAMRVCY